MFPFVEAPILEHLGTKVVIRTIPEEIDSPELVWHRDALNRKVVILSDNSFPWLFQRDSGIPTDMKKWDIIDIPKGEYHRVLRGSEDLIFLVIEVEDGKVQ